MKDTIKMALTKWHYPSAVIELNQSEVSFTDNNGVLDQTTNIVSVLPVRGTSTSTRDLITRESNALLFTDFKFENVENITGIQVEIHVTRLARIQDKQIQLYYKKPVGKNLFNLDAEDITVYGSSASDWGIQFSKININEPDFGIILDFQPHTQYPSSNQVYLRYVKIRAEYE